MDFINFFLGIIFAFGLPSLIVIAFYLDEKQFKKELKEEYEDLYKKLGEI